jgi:hypothetical protein
MEHASRFVARPIFQPSIQHNLRVGLVVALAYSFPAAVLAQGGPQASVSPPDFVVKDSGAGMKAIFENGKETGVVINVAGKPTVYPVDENDKGLEARYKAYLAKSGGAKQTANDQPQVQPASEAIVTPAAVGAKVTFTSGDFAGDTVVISNNTAESGTITTSGVTNTIKYAGVESGQSPAQNGKRIFQGASSLVVESMGGSRVDNSAANKGVGTGGWLVQNSVGATIVTSFGVQHGDARAAAQKKVFVEYKRAIEIARQHGVSLTMSAEARKDLDSATTPN